MLSFVLSAAIGLAPWAAWVGPSSDTDPIAAAERFRIGMFQSVAPSVVFIQAGSGFGSGFYVSSDGLILTNRHVVGKAKVVTVVDFDGRSRKGRVIELAAERLDLALVRVKASSTPALALGKIGDASIGSWIASVGHGSGGVWTFSSGHISNIYPDKKNDPVFQMQMPVNPGSSGGPVVDRHGRVVGIVTARLQGAESVNFAVSIDAARRGLSKMGGCDCLVVTTPKGASVFVDGKFAGIGPSVEVSVVKGRHEVAAIIAGKRAVKSVIYPATNRVEFSR